MHRPGLCPSLTSLVVAYVNPGGEQFILGENGANLWEIGRSYFVGLVVTPHQEVPRYHLCVLQAPGAAGGAEVPS